MITSMSMINKITNGISLINLKNLEDNYKKILICFSPVIPHFAHECLVDLGFKKNISFNLFVNY